MQDIFIFRLSGLTSYTTFQPKGLAIITISNASLLPCYVLGMSGIGSNFQIILNYRVFCILILTNHFIS